MKSSVRKNVIKEYLVVAVGTAAIGVGVYFFMIPSGIIMGTITGLAVIMVEILPLSLSTMTLILNLLCLVIGFVTIGKEFGSKTVFSSILLPMYLSLFEKIFPNNTSLTGEFMLDGLITVLIVGVGQAISFHVNASTGGVDILAKVLNKYMHMELGKAVAVMGMLIVGSSLLVYDIRTVIIGLLYTYFNGIVVNEFISGFSRKRKVCIISKNPQELKTYILQEINRGVTVYTVTGGFKDQSRQEIVTILNQNEYALLMQKIHEVDDQAFVTVSFVSEVAGSWRNREHNAK